MVPSVLQLVSSSLQAPVQQQAIRVYVSAPYSMQREVDLLKQVIVLGTVATIKLITYHTAVCLKFGGDTNILMFTLVLESGHPKFYMRLENSSSKGALP